MKKFLFIAVCCVLILSACKPTERNYRAAYDAALAKREKAEAEAMLPATGLRSVDGPQMKIVGGDTIFVSNERFKIPAGEERPMQYNVGVAMYKMSTNAKSMAEDLKARGYNTRALQATGDRWFTIAGSFPTLEEAMTFNKVFKKNNPGFRYVGLSGAPVIIRTQ